MAVTTRVLRMRARNGARLLDTLYAVAWRSKVDQNILDMGNWDRCVLGQVRAGCSFDKTAALNLDSERLIMLGFGLDYSYGRKGLQEGYARLTQVWKDILQEGK